MSGRRPFAAALLPLVLSGCFTVMLWESDEDDDEFADPESEAASDAMEIRYLDGRQPPRRSEPSAEWTPGIGYRLAMTPFTLLLDLVTCPIQCAWYCFAGDDEDDHHAESRAERRERESWRR